MSRPFNRGRPNRPRGGEQSGGNGNNGGTNGRSGSPHRGGQEGRGLGRDGTPPWGPRGKGRPNRGDRGGVNKRGGVPTGQNPRRGGGKPGRGGIRTDGDGDIQMGSGQLARIQEAINQGTGFNVVSPKDVKMDGGESKHRPDDVPITVSRWINSNASNGELNGQKALVSWLEKKTNIKGSGQLKLKPERDGDDLIFWVREKDANKLLHMNDWVWAGITLKIEKGLPAGPPAAAVSAEALTAKTQLEQFLSSRYNMANQFLDLATMEEDPVVRQMGINEVTTDAAKSKFFPALMKVCDLHFDNPEKKRTAVQSVSLAKNGLSSAAPVTTLSQTFPQLKNLDLSNNQIVDTKGLEPWKLRFRHLHHLIISGNSIENTEYLPTFLKWWPKLQMINGKQVRTPEQVARGDTKLPLAILAADFRDEANIAETFIKTFFPLFDSDRPSIINAYYDADSTFSLSVNTSAPRAPDAEIRGVGWDPYIKQSRNLLKITHLPSRLSRAYTGPEKIRQIWSSLPRTKHPNLLTEPNKWLIECHSIPGLPDPSNTVIGGVGGLVITLHGGFEEFPASGQQNVSLRSFDRTFVLGPGTTPAGVRVISDVICLRAWGGFEAWLPNPDGSSALTHSETVNGMAVPDSQKSTEQLMMEKMILELSQKTNLNLQYARLCLESAQWNPDRALTIFAQTRDGLGAEAWL